MGSSSMKVHSFARGFWDNTHQMSHEPQPFTLGCKRFRPLAPKVSTTGSTNVVNGSPSFDLKSFIKSESGPRKLVSSPSNHHQKKDSPSHQVESQCHPGGTRWNPTQEQIGILEMLYKGGMRTPNAQQIEQITEQLSKYGKIEGKNVFYWFQNHKARERQKQKRTILGLTHNPRNWTPSSTTPLITSTTLTLDTRVELDHEQQQKQQMSPYKRKFRSWTFECVENNNLKKGHIDDDDEEHKVENKTLELFPLRPECP